MSEVGVDLADLIYGGERLASALPGEPIVLTEGEKSADAVRRSGLHAVGTVCGASATPGAAVVELFSGRHVVLWADNDDVGRAHMSRIGEALESAGVAELSIVRWPEAPEHGDAADATAERIRELVAEALARPIGPVAAAAVDSAEPEMVSAGPDEASGRKLIDRFQTARQIAAAVSVVTDWVCGRHLAFGVVTEVIGLPKGGKTTFWALAVRAIVDGLPFLGWPTTRCPVVILTEQASVTFRQVLERAGLTDRDDVVVLYRHDARDATWPEIVAAAVEMGRRIGARVLIVDTLPAWAGIRGDGENDSGRALEAMEPLLDAAARGLAVLLVRHQRKGGAVELADAGRGSGAFTGAVDIVVHVGRPPNPPRPTIRTLSALSRFDETPAELVIELTAHGYVSLGDEASVARAEARSAVLDLVPDGPDGVTLQALLDRSGARRTTIQAAIGTLVDEGSVIRIGTGHKGSPHRFVRTPLGGLALSRDSIPDVSAETTPPGQIVSAAPTGRGGRQKAIQLVPAERTTAVSPTESTNPSADVFAATDTDDEPGDVWSIFGEPAAASA